MANVVQEPIGPMQPVGRVSYETGRPKGIVRVDFTRYLVPAGRVFLALIFLLQSLGHFSRQAISYAAFQGVPFPTLLVPLSGLIALAGGLSVALGFKARIGAILLAIFLVPVTLMMHRFWAVPDPMMAQLQEVMFLKNLAMLGGIFIVAYFGAGPVSIDASHRHSADTRSRLEQAHDLKTLREAEIMRETDTIREAPAP